MGSFAAAYSLPGEFFAVIRFAPEEMTRFPIEISNAGLVGIKPKHLPGES